MSLSQYLCITQCLWVQVVVNELLALYDVLCVLAMTDRAGHLLLLLIVHLGVDVPAGQLSEMQPGMY